jgi:hypothetical protein
MNATNQVCAYYEFQMFQKLIPLKSKINRIKLNTLNVKFRVLQYRNYTVYKTEPVQGHTFFIVFL